MAQVLKGGLYPGQVTWGPPERAVWIIAIVTYRPFHAEFFTMMRFRAQPGVITIGADRITITEFEKKDYAPTYPADMNAIKP